MQPVDAPVLTPWGWKQIGDLKPGSKICATDGTVQEVIAVHPHGEQDIYRVTMRDGGTIEVGAEHLWVAWPTHGVVKKANAALSGHSAARKYTTQQMIDELSKPDLARGRKRGFAIPVSGEVALNVAGGCVGLGNFVGRPVDPYFLGLLIGDGSLVRENGLSLTSMDDEIAVYLRDLVQADLREADREGNRAKAYYFRGRFREQLVKSLTDLGLLGHRSGSKMIPRQYLMADAETRWALMRGLMDTDGWVEPGRACYFTTVSQQLADDFVFLARSLGGVTSISEKAPSYTNADGDKVDGQKAYCVRIRIDRPERMFSLQRKRSIASDVKHQSRGRFIKSIEFSRRAEAVCITVSHANSLYIGQDFIVTHNSDLELGLAFTAHQRSLIMRRNYTNLSGLTERAIQINGTRKGYNGSPPPSIRTDDGRLIQFGANQHLGDEQSFQGIPYDLKCFDEAVQFLEAQVRFHLGWLRTTDPKQRTRAVLGTNPPVDASGDWIIGMFRPWLDVTHHKPAQHGELRWFITDEEGNDLEIDESDLGRDELGRRVIQRDGRVFVAQSRTFIPSALKDNPYLLRTNYQAQLDALPEPIRSAVRDGNFMAARADADFQCIPTDWIIQAQARWKPRGGDDWAMTAMGFDPAGGGADAAELVWRCGPWFSDIITVQGEETADGSSAAATIVKYRRDNAPVVVDVGGGYGGAVSLRLKDNDIPFQPFNGATATGAKTIDRTLGFQNLRAEAWWRMREALDPDREGGATIALPPSPELRADLAAPTFTVGPRGILLEPKEKLRERLGRSPGKGDAVVMAHLYGPEFTAKRVRHRADPSSRQAYASVGYGDIKRRRRRAK